ncbi:MAG: hypothetical protein JWQ18_444 [Conexibacter sp.]|nr:hypothetical protein [Conexibacter sp.]
MENVEPRPDVMSFWWAQWAHRPNREASIRP